TDVISLIRLDRSSYPRGLGSLNHRFACNVEFPARVTCTVFGDPKSCPIVELRHVVSQLATSRCPHLQNGDGCTIRRLAASKVFRRSARNLHVEFIISASETVDRILIGS